jgi:Alpha/beta hydrolase
MVTYRDLRDSRPERLNRALDAWSQLVRDARKLERDVGLELARPLRASGWRGTGADAAFRITDRLDDEFELAALQVENAVGVMRYARQGFMTAQENLKRILASADRLRMRVNPEGRIFPPDPTSEDYRTTEAYQRYEQIKQTAQQYDADVQKILADVTKLDEDCSKMLERFHPSVRGQMSPHEWRDASGDARDALEMMGVREDAVRRFLEGKSPAEVRAWWGNLGAEQRSLYLAAFPELIGGLDGVPAGDRHPANMINLRNHIVDQTALVGRPHVGLGEQGQLILRQQRLDSLNGMLNRIEASEYGPESQRLHLLGINNTGDGRAIVAVGNPDTARTIGVVVPGIWTTIDGMDYQIDRAANLQGAADQLTPAQNDVAVIAWLGYDTPEGVTGPPSGERARQGAPVLDSYIDGIRATQSEGARVIVVGHSYAAAVIGTAASTGNGLAVDGIMVAGAPGMRVPDGSHLIGLRPDQIWAGSSYNDVVTFLGPWAHDTAPHTVEFGANRFYVDTSGHSDYWTRGSISLQNQALILMNQTDDPRFRRHDEPFPVPPSGPRR